MKKSVFVTKIYRKINKILKNFSARRRDSITLILNTLTLAVRRAKNILQLIHVAEAFFFHSREALLRKS